MSSVGRSLCLGAFGAGVLYGVRHVMAVGGPAPYAIGAIITGAIVTGMNDAWESRSVAENDRLAAAWTIPPTNVVTRKAIARKMRKILGEKHHTLRVTQNTNGTSRLITMHMRPGAQGGEDFISYASINEPGKEWIAVARNAEKTQFDLCERSTFFNEDGSLKLASHPTTRVALDSDMFIHGSTLSKLLSSAELAED